MRDPSPLRVMTVEEYLRFDEQAESRHEYVRGEVYAMSGSTVRHATIGANIFTRLFASSADGPCRVFTNIMRVRATSDIYYYPDIAIVCGHLDDQAIFADDPCVIVEVTSPSTARVDRSEKLDAYREIAGLRAYLIVDHRRRRVERHWRDASDAPWQRAEVVGDGHVPIPCLDVDMSLDEIYRRVELPAVWEPEPAEYEA